MGLVLKASGEIDLAGVAGGAVTVDQSPEVAEHYGQAAGGKEGALEDARRRIEDVDGAVTKVPDQEIAGEATEAGGGDVEPPGRIQPTPRGDPAFEHSAEAEGVDITEVWSRDGVVLRGVLFAEGDLERISQVLHIERRISRRHRRVCKYFH